MFRLRRRPPAQRVHVQAFASSQQESLIKRAARDMFNRWFDPDDKTRSVSKPHVISNNFEGPSLETTRLVIVDQVHKTRRIPHLSGERPLFGTIDRALRQLRMFPRERATGGRGARALRLGQTGFAHAGPRFGGSRSDVGPTEAAARDHQAGRPCGTRGCTPRPGTGQP